jgi:hypothetical protein
MDPKLRQALGVVVVAAAVVAAAAIGAALVWFWFGLPLSRKARDRNTR